MTDEPRTCIPYTRQSRARIGETRATSLSLESQEADIRAWAERQGWRVEPAIRDHDEVGDDPRRPGLAELEARVAPGVTVAVWKWDRFARDLVLQETIVRALERRGVAVVSISEPSNRLTRAIYGAVNEDFKRTLSERLASIYQARARRGIHHGPAPFGWRQSAAVASVDDDGAPIMRPSGPIEHHPEQAPIVVEAAERFAAGESFRALAFDFQRRGVRTERGNPWNSTAISRMLRNPTHAGHAHYRSEIVASDVFPPIIPAELWDRVQRRIATNVTVKAKRELSSWVEGLVVHSCGRRMYLMGIEQIHAVRKPIPSFACQRSGGGSTDRCREPRRHIVAVKLEPAARACLSADLAALLPLDAAVSRARLAAGGRDADRSRRELDKRRLAAEHRHARARERWLAGRDPLTVMDAEDDRLATDLAAIEQERRRLPAPPDVARSTALHARLRSLAEVIDGASDDQLRATLIELGVIVVGEPGAWIAYHPEVAALLPAPTVAPIPTGRTSPKRAELWPE